MALIGASSRWPKRIPSYSGQLRSFLQAAAVAGLILCFALPSASQVLVTRQDAHHDVSPPLRDLVKASAAQPAVEPHEAEKLRVIPLPVGLKPASEPDSVLQRTTTVAPEPLAPAVIRNFDGIGQGVPTTFVPCCVPPDTNGAVGLTQYVQWVNLSFAVFDKATTNITLGPALGKTLWAGFGNDCETRNDGDPVVLYDKLADRWVFSQFAINDGFGPFLQCVAVSTTSDATGTFNRYSFLYPSFDDYPKMGVWPDAYYITFNMFDRVTGFLGADACAYDRGAMLNGQPATQVCFQQGSSVGSLLPSDLDGHTAPPAGAPDYLLTLGENSLDLFKFHVDFATPANSTFTGPTSIPVAPFTPLCGGASSCVPQAPGDGTLLDSLADRLMFRLAYRNFGDHESLVVNHSVDVNSNSGIRWYEIQNPGGTPLLAQQSTYAPDANSRWMGSIAMDSNGDIALGYSLSSSSMFPSIAFAGRAFSDPASTLGAETTLINGTGSQIAFSRWGDYSAMQVDPSDDCTFWYTQEYLKATGSFNWNTRIAAFKFPGCGVPDLIVAIGHSGNFTQGQTGGTYAITVTNGGGKGTDGTTVTVSDTLPAGLTATAASGTGWACTLGISIVCTRGDILAAHASYPAITVTVDVANNAPGSVTNAATVAGGGEQNTGNDAASDPTTIIQTGQDLAIAMTHAGSFFRGQTGVYTITVANVGLSPTDGTLVTVADTLPSGLTATNVTGAGWVCTLGATTTCTRGDTLASNAAYPSITLTVTVAGNAVSVVNTATVSGGGDTNSQNNAAGDSTTIVPPPPDLTMTMSHAGNFNQGQQFASYTLTVSNQGAGPTNATVTVTSTLPPGFTAGAMQGPGWSCNFLICTRGDVLAAGASYPLLTFFVNVANNAPASVTTTATVFDGGDLTPGNNTATDLTMIDPSPDLTVAMSHSPDPLILGETGTYTLTVSNVGNAATSGAVAVDSGGPGLTITAISAPGWSCSQPPTITLDCKRTDALAAGSSYPALTVTVSVDVGIGPIAASGAHISGGGEFNFANDFAFDGANVVGLRFVPVVPCRIADTRNPNGPFGGPFLAGQTSRGFTIPDSACNIPATALAYSLNVTVVPHGALGFLTTFPCGKGQPPTSTLNSDGRVKAVSAIVPADVNGAVCFFVTNDTDLVLDINGYFVTASTPSSLSFYSVTPCRIADTRGNGFGGLFGPPALVGNAPGRTFPILSGPCNLPATAQAYSMNYTAVPKTTLGFLTTWPAGQTRPAVSTLNATTGTVTANAAIVQAGTNGDVSVFVTDDSDLVIDINGYFAPPGLGGLSLFPVSPCRAWDTRLASRPPFSGTILVDLGNNGCVPVFSQAAVLNATVVPSGPLGFLTLWPQGASQPLVSTLNAIDGAVTSNMAIVPTTQTLISAFASNPSHLVVDVSGYFAATPGSPASPVIQGVGTIPRDGLSIPDPISNPLGMKYQP